MRSGGRIWYVTIVYRSREGRGVWKQEENGGQSKAGRRLVEVERRWARRTRAHDWDNSEAQEILRTKANTT